MRSACLNWQRDHSITFPVRGNNGGVILRPSDFAVSTAICVETSCASTSLLVLEFHVFIGGPDRHWNQFDRVIGDSLSFSIQHTSTTHWRVHYLVTSTLLLLIN